MIPHKLQLKNFLSYGPQLQTIDFSGHSLICLSGKNGHGKSALLDAMTWAVWGQARKVIGAAKADQGLLRLGQTQMVVIFDFEFNGTLYRIRREYMETFNKPIASLEFASLNPETQEFIPLTDKTIRTTQAKIEQTLRLDFDSFANSAFLRQGNSNEFSKKTPKDRKCVLASILGLDQYEAIRQQAVEKIKDATAKKTGLLMVQEKRKNDLAAQNIIDQELITLNHTMKALKTEEKEWNAQQEALKKTKLELDHAQNQYNLVVFQHKQLNEQKTGAISNLTALRTQWRTINAKKQNIHNAHALEQQKKQLLADITNYQKIMHAHLAQKEELLRISQEINAIEQNHKNDITQKQNRLIFEIQRLNSDRDSKEKIIALLEDEFKKNEYEHLALVRDSVQLNALIIEQTVNPDLIKRAEQLLEKRKATYQSFVSLGNWITAELKNISQKKNLIHADDPSCPLCEQNLSSSRKRLLSTNFCKQESFFLHRLQRLKRILPLIKEKLIGEHEQLTKNKEIAQTLARHTDKIKEIAAQQNKIALANREINAKITILQQEISTLATTLQEQQKQRDLIEKEDSLVNNESYQALLHTKNSLEQKLQEQTYSRNSYAEKQAELTALELQLSEYDALQQDVAQQQSRASEIHKLCIVIKQLKKEIFTLDQQLASYADSSKKLANLFEQENQLHNALVTLQNKKEALLQTKGRIESEQKRLALIKSEHEAEQKTIATLESIIQDYLIICNATGKDGIQALLIEEAIPEIEQEANQLLAQLTNNQAQIFIESLKDLKKGGTKETLDIKIADQNGIRPYELFSGGEAFRIDFALRIAISKLLARRAGTALQTLIIDEGFGSQDDEGLSHIMDALHAIQNNFSKIIVVSHLPAMKDQFPVQFVIQKGVQGSTITVVEQG